MTGRVTNICPSSCRRMYTIDNDVLEGPDSSNLSREVEIPIPKYRIWILLVLQSESRADGTDGSATAGSRIPGNRAVVEA